MKARRKILATLALAAMVATPALSSAAGFTLGKGRTRAIRTAIAKQINTDNLMHVGNKIRSQDIRIRTKREKMGTGPVYCIGSDNRSVTWRHATNIVQGTAKSHTPVIPNGGKLTSISGFKYTSIPRSILPPPTPPINQRQEKQ